MNKYLKLVTAFFSAYLLRYMALNPVKFTSEIGQVKTFWYLLVIVLIINVLMTAKITGIKFRNLTSRWDFFIIPVLFSTGIFFFVASFPNIVLQEIIAVFFGVSLYFVYVSLEACKQKKMALAISFRNLLTIFSLMVVFLISSLIYNFYSYWELPVFYLVILHFAFIYGINHFLTKQMLVAPSVYSHLYNFIISLIIAQLSFILSFWSVNYPASFGNLSSIYSGIPVASLIILVTYYCAWGITYYLIEGRLTNKVVYEYLSVGSLAMLLLLISTKWMPFF